VLIKVEFKIFCLIIDMMRLGYLYNVHIHICHAFVVCMCKETIDMYSMIKNTLKHIKRMCKLALASACLCLLLMKFSSSSKKKKVRAY
jgi:hypothetical protein